LYFVNIVGASIPIAAGNRVCIGGGEVVTIGTYEDLPFTSNVWKLDFKKTRL
jgi:hypothetical protein